MFCAKNEGKKKKSRGKVEAELTSGFLTACQESKSHISDQSIPCILTRLEIILLSKYYKNISISNPTSSEIHALSMRAGT